MAESLTDAAFLDEMAQRRRWDSISHNAPVVHMTEAERDRLVALARRAPALTCGTCLHFDWRERGGPPFKMADGHLGDCDRLRMLVKYDFGCKFHAPAPPEARP